ncbi:MAG: hypothetical protein COB36_12545 [Alphaproteobacteria bacterium]|nr:MAG: hypothetical protein COB36_12545 [Alphaproteobacteria bacterium]
MKKILAIAIPAALIGALTAVLVIKNVPHKSIQKSEPTYARPYVLLDIMHQFQRYADKIYFASQAKNQQLTSWYLWKLEHSALSIAEHKTKPWSPPDVDEAALIKDMFIPAIQDIYQPVKEADWDEVNRRYETLVATCNSCHEILEHGFVNIRIPDQPIYRNQDYAIEE